jgi:GMP synthase (glutamine-hydrolysing)
LNRRALIVQHVSREGLAGYRAPIERAGFTIERLVMCTASVDELDFTSPDLLVLLGGPMGIYQEAEYPWLLPEIAAVARRLEAGLPTLGVCLGAQIIAKALGAKVYPNSRVEVGFAPVTLTDKGRSSVLGAFADTPVLHWHGDTFDLPDGAERLAATAITPNQAFRIGDHVLALQFHGEMGVDERIHDWIEHCCECLDAAGTDPSVLLADYAVLGPRAVKAGQAVIAAWLRQLEAVETALQPRSPSIRTP